MNNGIIPQLQEEIATLKAALNASNAALAEARKLIRDIASRDLDISEGYRHVSYNAIVIEAKKQVASWDSAVAATTEDAPAPKFKVGDKVRLNFFEHYEKGEHEVVAKVCSGFYRLEIDGEYNDTTEYYDFELTPYNESE